MKGLMKKKKSFHKYRGHSLKLGTTGLPSKSTQVIKIVRHLSFNCHLSAKIEILTQVPDINIKKDVN